MNDELEAQAEAQLAATETVSVPVQPTEEEQRKQSLEALGLTEEDLKPAETPEATDEQKHQFREVTRWGKSDNFKEIVKEITEQADIRLEEIKKEMKKRKEIKLEASELTKLNMYAALVTELIEKVDRSTEGGELVAQNLEIQVKNSLSHVFGEVKVGFDAPMYTRLDMMKEARNFCLTIEQRLNNAIKDFDYSKTEVPQSAHPYEE